MENHFLDRFLFDISNKEPPKISDLKLIAKALIEMHDYDVSFKKAFGLTGTGGAKPKIKHVSNAFKSMSDGFLRNPLYLNCFLSKVDQGLLPKTEDLEKVATALLKMRDKKVRLKKAFGIIQQTGKKPLDITRLSFNDLIRSEKWIVYHDFKRFKAIYAKNKRSYLTPLVLMEEKYYLSSSKLERIYSEVQKCVPIYLEPIQIKQRELWSFYFTNRKYFETKDVASTIDLISKKSQYDEKSICSKFIALYEEVALYQKYVIILRGSLNYPRRIQTLLTQELKPIYEFSKKGDGG